VRDGFGHLDLAAAAGAAETVDRDGEKFGDDRIRRDGS
jgi:hypothetical protein